MAIRAYFYVQAHFDPPKSLEELKQAALDPQRAIIPATMLDGRAHTATELALIAEVEASTASGHPAALERG